MADLIYQYLLNLREDYRLDLTKYEFTTIDEVIRVATKREQNTFSEKQNKMLLMASTKSKQKQINCNYCKKPGHIARDCYSRKR